MDESVETNSAIPDMDETFAEALDFQGSLDARNWKTPGEHYQSISRQIRQVVDDVVESDERMRNELRKNFFPQLIRAGTFRLGRRDNRYVEKLQREHLYAGHVFAADGTLARYETLSLVGAQIAVSRVSY